MSEMTGLERLRALGREQEERSWSTVGKVRGRLMLQIAEQIEDERFREQLAVERVASEMELHCLGVEGMDDSPVARWARELREALGGDECDHADEREAIAWVRKHGGLDMVRRMFRDADSRRVELCGALGIDLDKGWSEAMAAMRLRLVPEGMEWPRFQDGEPVPLGGEVTVTVHDKDGDFDRTLAIRSIKYKESGVLLEGTKNEMVVLSYGECVKRPAPKVLDADGAEIREKCDVWWICEGDERGVHAERLRVETICPNGLIECSPYNGGTWVYLEPSELYVNKPVPSSDGRPLREGDYVWDMGGNGPYEVVGFTKSGYVRIKSDFGLEQSAFCERLTHERPDSWERLEEDATRLSPYYYARDVIGLDTDKMPPKESRRIDMMRDLVRRARALAERGA